MTPRGIIVTLTGGNLRNWKDNILLEYQFVKYKLPVVLVVGLSNKCTFIKFWVT